MTKSPEDNDSDLWEFWDRDEEFYNLVSQYYGQHPDDGVDIHESGGAADSDSELEVEVEVEAGGELAWLASTFNIDSFKMWLEYL